MNNTRRLTAVWLVLILATVTSWLTSAELGTRSAPVAMVALLAVTCFKIRLIGLHFMEIRTAPMALRGWFEAYVAVVFAALTALGLVT